MLYIYTNVHLLYLVMHAVSVYHDLLYWKEGVWLSEIIFLFAVLRWLTDNENLLIVTVPDLFIYWKEWFVLLWFALCKSHFLHTEIVKLLQCFLCWIFDSMKLWKVLKCLEVFKVKCVTLQVILADHYLHSVQYLLLFPFTVKQEMNICILDGSQRSLNFFFAYWSKLLHFLSNSTLKI